MIKILSKNIYHNQSLLEHPNILLIILFFGFLLLKILLNIHQQNSF